MLASEIIKLPKDAFHKICRDAWYACPKVVWDSLKLGDMILTKNSGFIVTKIPPKRGFVIASNALDATQIERFNRKQYEANLLLATDEFKAIVKGKSHEEYLKDAIAAGIELDPWVKYDYLELFTPMPAEWSESERTDVGFKFGRMNEWRSGNVRDHGPNWPIVKIQDWIASERNNIAEREAFRQSIIDGTAKDIKPGKEQNVIDLCDGNLEVGRQHLKHLLYLQSHIENIFGVLQAA